MLQFPANLLPTRIEIESLPHEDRAEGIPRDKLVERSITLQDIPTGGTLALIFENYSVQPELIAGYASAENLNAACGIDIGGWVGAWNFWNITRYGHLVFEIPTTHDLWERINYKAEWMTIGLDGLPAIWRIIEAPNMRESGHKFVCNFKIVIRQSLRSPKYV